MNVKYRKNAITVRVLGSVLAYRCDATVEVGDTVVIETGVHAGREGTVTQTLRVAIPRTADTWCQPSVGTRQRQVKAEALGAHLAS